MYLGFTKHGICKKNLWESLRKCRKLVLLRHSNKKMEFQSSAWPWGWPGFAQATGPSLYVCVR